MKTFDELTSMIDEGIKGYNKGLHHGFSRLIRLVPNIQKGTYYTIGGETGSGKTAFTDHAFLYSPYDYIMNKDIISLKVIYFSLEIDYKIKLIKGIARRLYIDTGILLSVNELLSKGSYTLPKDVRYKIDSYREYFDKLDEVLDIYDGSYTPSHIKNILAKYAKENGNWIKRDGKNVYIPNDKNRYTIVVIDHVGLISPDGQTKKQAIDEVSKTMIFYRNLCNFTPVIVSQFNRTISSTDRFKIKRVEPQLSDFMDSSATQQDANIVFGLFAPYRYDIDNYKGYNVSELDNEFRALHILKNRDGDDNAVLGLQFKGAVGHFSELERPKTI